MNAPLQAWLWVVTALFALSGVTWANDRVVLWHGLDSRVSRWISSGAGPGLDAEAYVEPEVALFERFPDDPWPDMILVPSNLIGLKDEFRFSEVPRALLKSIDPGILRTVRSGHRRYFGVPVAAGDLIMLFRGSETPRVSELGANTLGIAWEQPYYFIPFLRAWDAVKEGPGGELNLDPTALEQALRGYSELNTIPGSRKNCNQDCAFRLLLKGESRLAISDFSQVSKAHEGIRPGEVQVDALPRYRGRTLRPWYASYALVFPNRSLSGPHARALRDVIQRLLEDKNQSRLYSELHKLPVTRAALDRLRSQATSGDTEAGALLEELQASEAMPNDRAMISLWPALRKTLREYYRMAAPDPKALAVSAVRLYSDYRQRYEKHLAEVLKK